MALPDQNHEVQSSGASRIPADGAVEDALQHLTLDRGSASRDSNAGTLDGSHASSKALPPVQELLQRCRGVMQELEEYIEDLRLRKRLHAIEYRHFKGLVGLEVKSLEKMAAGDVAPTKIQHCISSSNLPFLEAVWSAAKRSTGIVAFQKRFYWDPPPRRLPQAHASLKPTAPKSKKCSALVDIAADNGAEWIKVSTISETRLLFEMAKQGWEQDDISSDDEDEQLGKPNASDTDDDDDLVSIVKMSEDLLRASQATRVRYRHPRIRFVLPKLSRGRVPEIDDLIDGIQERGVIVELANDLPSALAVGPVLKRMNVDEFKDFSNVLNIDCTILLALVSDLSHVKVVDQSWHHRAIRRQIEMEEKESLLSSSLYPAMGSHPLVCTSEAAQRMREIVDTIGTPSERARTVTLMGDEGSEKSHDQLIEDFQRLSEHTVPREWALPIKVISRNSKEESLPPIAELVGEQLSAINQSVFLYGWANGLTTISSNRTVARQIEATIEENRDSDDLVGPDVWLCSMARSLVGKEKNRKT